MRRLFGRTAALLSLLLAAGCASVPETRFYTLSLPFEPPEIEVSRGSSTPIFIDVLPISVPERLARPQLVVRSGASGPQAQLLILEQDRWSSPFNYELRDAFTSGIASQIGAVNNARGIRTPDQISYRIAIELSQFDAIVGDRVQTGFGWTITHSTDGRSIACHAAITEPIAAGIEGVVAGIQRVVASVVADVSKNLIELDSDRVPTCVQRKAGLPSFTDF
jgi:hypothetical protein